MRMLTFNCPDLALKTHSGLFQLLPLGLRVQEKLERLIDKHMVSLGTYRPLQAQKALLTS